MQKLCSFCEPRIFLPVKISDNKVTTEQKKFTVLIKEDEKRVEILPAKGSKFFVTELMHKRSKTDMLPKLKFVRKGLSNTVTGKERFSFKYLFECKLKHISITLTKDNFIMPKFRKRNGGVIFDFFSLKIDESLVSRKNKRNS